MDYTTTNAADSNFTLLIAILALMALYITSDYSTFRFWPLTLDSFAEFHVVLIKYTVTLCVFKHGDDMREWQPTAQRHKLRLLDVIHIYR